MKPLTSLVLAVALIAPLVASAAGFEGKIVMSMTTPRGSTIPMTFSLKSGFQRIDMEANGHAFGMIVNDSTHETTILMPQQKMYMVRPISQPPAGDSDGPKRSEVAIEKTGEHAKILGYDTTKYVAKTKEGTTEVWVTDQLGTFMGLGNGGNPMGGFGNRPGAAARAGARQAWEDAFRGKDAFPLRATTTNGDGKQTFKMEATSIDQASLPDSLFAPPADYRKFDMENMMRGMGMPGGMPHPSGE